jgi:hypothetical protein
MSPVDAFVKESFGPCSPFTMLFVLRQTQANDILHADGQFMPEPRWPCCLPGIHIQGHPLVHVLLWRSSAAGSYAVVEDTWATSTFLDGKESVVGDEGDLEKMEKLSLLMRHMYLPLR